MDVDELLDESKQSVDNLVYCLENDDPEFLKLLAETASSVLEEHCGKGVYLRGLIEFSNVCVRDCLYCGIRRSNSEATRFSLTKEEIVDCAVWCAAQGFGSVVLQSGERTDEKFVDFVARVVEAIKARTVSDVLPQGIGVTLCVGEQSREVYQRLFEAGAHRYLLRIETTNPELYRNLHPEEPPLNNRIDCLRALKEVGYQVGTGVMIDLPGQTSEDLIADILFFRDEDIDMIGMGPYIPHYSTPMGKAFRDDSSRAERALKKGLKMIALTRIVLRDVNIAATTALQALDPFGREKGLQCGANVMMPLVTPPSVRKNYQLYEGKPCLDDAASQCSLCTKKRIEIVGRNIVENVWGDSPHYFRRT